MAEVEITPVKAAPRGHLRVHASLPLAALDEQRCIRDQRVPADMIEMKVRVDDEVNLAGISVYGLQSCADFFARLKPDTEKASEPFTESFSGVVLAIRVQPRIEQCASLGVLDQKYRDRYGDIALSPLHQMCELAGHRAASESVELDCHLRSAGLADGIACLVQSR
jgi:hypothetical protein